MNYGAAGCNLEEMINYQKLRSSWYAYMDLLLIDYNEGFLCDKCGPFPSVISCDATTLGFRKIFAPSFPDLTIDLNTDHEHSGR